MQKPAVCFASIALAMLTSTSCKYTAGPVNAHITSKEKYSRFLFSPVPFHIRHKGMQHRQYKHMLMAVDVNFFMVYYTLFSDGEKWGREEKTQGGLVEYGKVLPAPPASLADCGTSRRCPVSWFSQLRWGL